MSSETAIDPARADGAPVLSWISRRVAVDVIGGTAASLERLVELGVVRCRRHPGGSRLFALHDCLLAGRAAEAREGRSPAITQ